MIGDFFRRKQTGEFTCGAAALTVAIAEIGRAPEENTDAVEERIWRQVQGRDETWSVPGKLAHYAWKGGPGIRSAIWQEDGVIARILAAVPRHLIGFDADAHLREHTDALTRAEANGVEIIHGAHGANTLTRLLDDGWRLLLVTILPSVLGLALHYLLGRYKSPDYGYAIMDPASGRNAPYSRDDLGNFLFGPAAELGGMSRYLGITVGVLDFPNVP